MKESGLRIRVEPDLRQRFIQACRAQDVTASQVLRHFMRRFIEDTDAERQTDLFDDIVVTQPE